MLLLSTEMSVKHCDYFHTSSSEWFAVPYVTCTHVALVQQVLSRVRACLFFLDLHSRGSPFETRAVSTGALSVSAAVSLWVPLLHHSPVALIITFNSPRYCQ